MQRNVSTTVWVKLHSLTTRKANLLVREYEAFQTEVHGGDADLYSATDQQASKVQRQKDPNPDTEQPVVLRNDVFDASHDEDTVLSSWWVNVPVFDPERGRGTSIWCPAHVPHKDEHLVREGNIRDSELVRRDGEWYVHLVVKRSVTVQDEYDVLAIDMGARWVATCAFLSDRTTTFYGEEVRRTREHYKQLRKSIGRAKLRQGQQVVERIGDVEARKVDDRLHKIARSIVADAAARNAIIVVGDLGGIRKDTDNGRYVNDKTHKMPFARLLNYIEYKAHDGGIDVQVVDEYDTSKMFDILLVLKGEDSHRQSHTKGSCVGSSRFAHRRGVGRVKRPLRLSSTRRFPSFPRGLRRGSADSEVPGCFASVPALSRWGTSEPRSGTPSLSDCLGVGAGVPRRMVDTTTRAHLSLRRTPKVDDDGDSSPLSRAGLSRLQSRNRCACEGIRESQGCFVCPECGLDDNADKNGALNIGKRALGKFSKPLSEAGVVLAQPETQVIVHRDDDPANLSVSVGSTSCGGTPRL